MDFGADDSWADKWFAFTTGDDISQARLRLGRWQVPTAVQFASYRLTPVTPVYLTSGSLVLGEGETVSGHRYIYEGMKGGEHGNCARTLASHTASFNSDRWTFQAGNEVVYCHELGGTSQTSGTVSLLLSNYEGGVCVVSVSGDGQEWNEVARLSTNGPHAFELPSGAFPSPRVYVRLRVETTSRGAEPEKSGFHVSKYRYESVLDKSFPVAEGMTNYVAVTKQDDGTVATWRSLGSFGRRNSDSLQLQFTPKPGSGERFIAELVLSHEGGTTQSFRVPVNVLKGSSASVVLPYKWTQSGKLSFKFSIREQGQSVSQYEARGKARLPDYYAASFGARLGSIKGFGEVWWCGSTYKVSPHRASPDLEDSAIRMSGAGRERVHAQLVLNFSTNPGDVKIVASDLQSPTGDKVEAGSVRLREVAYVPVETPTDSIGFAGEWPDPLLSIDGFWKPQAGRNNPVWITVAIPPDAKAGDYSGKITLSGSAWNVEVPLVVHVWDFQLSATTELRSGLGCSANQIRRYQNLTSPGAMAKVWDAYMKNFAEHRLNPYNPMKLAPVTTNLDSSRTSLTVNMNFDAFDAAAVRYLDGLGFIAFTIPVEGLGSCSYSGYSQGQFLGKSAGTPDYDTLMRQYGQQYQQHLEERGWLKKGYVYWFDEPTTEDYEFVNEGMARLKTYFPKFKRMLTEEIQTSLLDSVELWCPLISNYSEEAAKARQAKGEEVWWYICCVPHEPFVGEFIDHPAIEPRMWLWQTWKYGVDGILIWETCWWNSTARPAEQAVQNPYEDPMSYASQAGNLWGNGDGRFFYPANWRDPASRGQEYLGGPVDSLRWELLSIGVQDWEYFHMLDKLIRKLEKTEPGSLRLQQAIELLKVPDNISQSLKDYTKNPELLEIHREKLARAIESLAGLAKR
jgi:hypothetical protein